MKVLADTPIWSFALRRKNRAGNDPITTELASLIRHARVVMIGPIRQELLSGIKEHAQFENVREHLRPFADADLASTDYEDAASFYNRCRASGIQGSNTDFLICAVAVRYGLAIFTTDDDFRHFARVLPITLYEAATT